MNRDKLRKLLQMAVGAQLSLWDLIAQIEVELLVETKKSYTNIENFDSVDKAISDLAVGYDEAPIAFTDKQVDEFLAGLAQE